MIFEGIEKRQVFQGIAALLKCCQILSRHTYIPNGKTNLFFPYFPGFARCKRGVNCVRDGQKCLILQGKSAFVRDLPWQTNSIFIILKNPQKSPKISLFPANSSLRFVASGGTSWHGKVQKRCKIRCKTIAFTPRLFQPALMRFTSACASSKLT